MTDQRTIKVFADSQEQDALASQYTLIGHYDSFVVLAVSAAVAKRLAKSHLVEDITDEYSVRVGRYR